MIDAQSAFLERSGWGVAQTVPLAGDASARRYLRVIAPDGACAILMIAPVSEAADRASFDAFRRIGLHLRHLGLSAPEEYAADPESGLILMEDLGDGSLSRLLDRNAPEAEAAYRAVADVVPVIADGPAPAGLRAPGPEGMSAMAELAFDLLAAEGQDVADLRRQMTDEMTDALARLAGGQPVLALRDMHGDNLIWLPHRRGAARIGLLDYQDALRLPAGYDLASLVDDVRRDVPEAWRKNLIKDFSDRTGLPRQEAQVRIDLLSLQRNLRIIGVFRRLATALGKPGYARFQPRTRALVARSAASLPLSGLREPVTALLARTAHWGAP